jgi:hypothetical protein
MSRPVIHIGFPKTASSLLQETLFDSHPAIAGSTILGARRDAALARSFRLIMESDQVNFRASLPDLQRQLLDDSCTTVISHEYFCLGHTWRLAENWTDAADRQTISHNYIDRKRIFERLAALAPDASILLTIREQVSLIESLYMQLTGNPKIDYAYDRFLQDIWENRDFSSVLSGLDFVSLLSDLECTFSRDRITVLPYEYLQRDPELFVFELSRLLELCAGEVRQRVSSGVVNPRISKRRFVARRLKRAVPYGGYISSLVPQHLKRQFVFKGHQHHLTTSDEWRDRFHSWFASGNERLSHGYGLPLGQLGYAL